MRHREARSMQVVGTCFILICIKGRGIATCKWQTTVRLYTKEGLFKDAVANTTATECSCHTFMERRLSQNKITFMQKWHVRLYIKLKVGLEKKSFSLLFRTFIFSLACIQVPYFNKMTKSSKQISIYQFWNRHTASLNQMPEINYHFSNIRTSWIQSFK